MADLLDTFRQKTQDLFQAIDRKGPSIGPRRS